MAEADNSTMESKEYFRLPNLFSFIIVPFGMGLVTACTFFPELVPYELLGPVGRVAKHLVLTMPNILRGTCYMAWLAHAGEAYAAGKVAISKGLTEKTANKWRILVFFYGIFAFKFLLSYTPPNEEKEKAE